MAIAPDQLAGLSTAAKPGKEGAKAGAKPADTAPAAPGTRPFERASFLKGIDTGVRMNRRGGIEKRLSPEVAFTKELTDDFENYLLTYITNLAKLHDIPDPSNPSRTLFESTMNNPKHRYDKRLFEHLARDAKGGKDVESFDPKNTRGEIKKFLNTEDGWISTSQLIDDLNFIKMASVGMATSTLPEGQRQQLLRQMRLRPQRDTNAFNRIWRFLNQSTQRIRRGEQIDLSFSADALEVLKNDNLEKAYILAVAGVNADALQRVGTTNRVELIPGQALMATRRTPNDLLQEVLQGYHAQREFYKQVGIPAGRADFSPLQAIYRPNLMGLFEQTNTRWGEEVQVELVRAGGLPPGITEQMRRQVDANREVLLRRVERSISQTIKTPDRIGVITELRTARESGGPRIKAREAEIDKTKTRLTDDKNLISPDQTKLATYQNALKTLQDARDEAENEFGVRNITDINAQIIHRNDLLTKPVIVGSYARQVQDLETSRRAEIAAEVASIPGTLVGKARQDESHSRTRMVNERYDRMKANLKEQVADPIEQEIKRLKIIRQSMQDIERGLQDNQDKAREVTEMLSAIQTEFTTITGWGITEAQLRTLTLDQLLTHVNAAHTVIPTNGWPAERNTRPENRMRIIRATIEAKARAIETADPLRTPARIADYSAVTSWGVSENQLRILTQDQLMLAINQAHTRNPAFGWDATGNANPANITRLTNSIQEVQNRFQVRSSTYDEHVKTIDELIKQQEEAKQGLQDRLQPEIQRSQILEDFLRRQDEFLENAGDVITQPERFADNRTVPLIGDPEYARFSQAERDTVAPRGYFEIIDLLFDYRNHPGRNRDEYLRGIQALLPPAKLAEIIDRTLGLGLGAPGITLDIGTVLSKLNTEIAANNIGDVRIRRAFGEITDTLYAETTAARAA